ncbi:MAG: Mbeg1-like protein [Slackia sp.]
MRYFVQEDAAAIEKQFCACTFSFGGKTPLYYLAFRGTDGTLAGWKEDFNLSYRKVIPSQRSAERYVSGVLSALPLDARIMVGGHSKGGNLAEFAAATVDETSYERIERIFNHDGPSFLNSPSPRFEEQHFKDKLDKTVPESSIFGMMLEHRDDFSVVQSQATGIFQHNPFSWLTCDDDFLYQESLNPSAAFFDQTLDRWLKSCTPEQRETSSTPYTSSSSQATPQVGKSSTVRGYRTSPASYATERTSTTKPKRSSCTIRNFGSVAKRIGTRAFRQLHRENACHGEVGG